MRRHATGQGLSAVFLRFGFRLASYLVFYLDFLSFRSLALTFSFPCSLGGVPESIAFPRTIDFRDSGIDLQLPPAQSFRAVSSHIISNPIANRPETAQNSKLVDFHVKVGRCQLGPTCFLIADLLDLVLRQYLLCSLRTASYSHS